MKWYLAALKKYATFRGRASRSEFWFFTLFNLIAYIVLIFLDGMFGTFDEEGGIGLLSGIYSLGVILPSFAVSVRRLHDTDRTGWWMLISLIPLIGTIVLFVFWCQKGTSGTNRFGDDPLGGTRSNSNSGNTDTVDLFKR